MRNAAGTLHGIPWIVDIFMAGCSRWDILQEAGQQLPDTFDDVISVSKAIHKKNGIPAYIAEKHHGWTFIPWLMGFGGGLSWGYNLIKW